MRQSKYGGQVRQVRASVPPEWIHDLEESHGETHGLDYAHTVLDLWLDSTLRRDELPFTPDDLRKIACPTPIFPGDRDPFFPVRVPVTMYQAIPNSELCIVPNCAHGVPFQSPTIFVTALLDFLDRNPMAGSGA